MGLRRKQPGRRRRLRRIDLKKTLFVLPNAITLASIFCGFNAILIVSTGSPSGADFYKAAMLLMFAMFFDLLDGRVARMTKTQSAFGLQIDSLADIVSFGVAPSVLIYKWSLYRFPTAGVLAAFMFTACGAIRLARFNVLSSDASGTPMKPGKYVTGLPIPPASGVLITLVVANHAASGALGGAQYSVLIMLVTVVLSLLMVSNIQFRSFKDLKLNAGTVLFVLFMVGSSAVVWQKYEPTFVLVWLLSMYIAVGILEWLRSIPSRLKKARERAEMDTLPPAE